LSNLTVNTITQQQPTLYITDIGFTSDTIYVASDKGILLRWESEQLLGLKSENWDSGLRDINSVWITPNINEDNAELVTVYNEQQDTVQQILLSPLSTCDNGSIPVFMRFIDDLGSAEGYSILVDQVPVRSAIQYDNGEFNQAAFQIIGDNETHTLAIVDDRSGGCIVTAYL